MYIALDYGIINACRGGFMVKTIKIVTLDDMETFATNIARHLFPGFLLCLSGDLGAGKTTFTKYLGKAMGIKETITSPTFTIMNTYESTLDLHHIDAYRLTKLEDEYTLEDAIYSQGVTVIEWYENIVLGLPKEYLSIEIRFEGNQERTLVIKGRGVYETIVKALIY